MPIDNKSDADIVDILQTARTIALVGASLKPERAANYVMKFLVDRGNRVIGVNPGLAGKTIHGAPVVATLADIDLPIDMVDVFRNSEDALGTIEEALALPRRPAVIWLQLGVINRKGFELAEDAGVTVVMDRCPIIEVNRLGL